MRLSHVNASLQKGRRSFFGILELSIRRVNGRLLALGANVQIRSNISGQTAELLEAVGSFVLSKNIAVVNGEALFFSAVGISHKSSVSLTTSASIASSSALAVNSAMTYIRKGALASSVSIKRSHILLT